MVEMTCEITIGDYIFRVCNSFSGKRSWKNIVQTASIKLHNITGLIDKIKVGDEVEIKSGYDGDNKTEFLGYVSDIMPTMPVEIKCECKMWKLKQTKAVPNSWKSTTLKNVLTYLVPDAHIECPDVTLSPFRLQDTSIAKALQVFKDEYMLAVYYRYDKLFIGLPYTETGLRTVNYLFNAPGANANIDGLVYKNATDVKTKVKAISIFPDGKKITKEFGDDDGNFITLHYYNKKESELEALAKEQISRMKYDGYRGTFKAKAVPYIDHGDVCNISNAKYPARDQGVFVDSVSFEFSPSGFFRTIEAGKKIFV